MGAKITIINEDLLSLLLKNKFMYRFIILLVVLLSSIVPFQAQDKYEVRATWITTLGSMDWPCAKANSPIGIKRQQEELCKILDELKAAQFNTILFQTRLRGDVIYPSFFESYAECLTGRTGRNPGYDPLNFAIQECHKRGMAFHAWIVTIPIGSRRQVKLQQNQSIVKKHPSMCIQFRENWYLDPGNPKTATYLSAIVREIVSKYDVDGIHFDYLRYPEQGKRFPDYQSYKRYGKKQPLDQWRRENSTRLVRQLYADIKALKPWVIVSSSPVGKFNDTQRYSTRGWNAYKEVNQNAQGWLKEGIHDALFPMMYFKNNHFFPFALDWQENNNQRWIVPGLGIYFLQTNPKDWKLDDIEKQIYFIRNNKLDGEAYFRNKFLMNNVQGIWDELKMKFYTTPAVTPPLTWLDSIAPATPTLKDFRQASDSTIIRWNPSTTQKAGGIRYRIYASDTYPVDCEKGANMIATDIQDTSYTFRPELPWLNKLYWSVTAVDRYGNESTPLTCNQSQDFSLAVYHNQLPAIPSGSTLIISDATGKELFRTRSIGNGILRQLNNGFYRINLLSADGSIKLIGTLVR